MSDYSFLFSFLGMEDGVFPPLMPTYFTLRPSAADFAVMPSSSFGEGGSVVGWLSIEAVVIFSPEGVLPRAPPGELWSLRDVILFFFEEETGVTKGSSLTAGSGGRDPWDGSRGVSPGGGWTSTSIRPRMGEAGEGKEGVGRGDLGGDFCGEGGGETAVETGVEGVAGSTLVSCSVTNRLFVTLVVSRELPSGSFFRGPLEPPEGLADFGTTLVLFCSVPELATFAYDL